jgi:cardiolipin synthase
MTDTWDPFLGVVAEVARSLDSALVRELSKRIASLPAPPIPTTRFSLTHDMVPARARRTADQLLSRWATLAPDLPPVAVATALRMANVMDAWHRERTSSELVWTGPTGGDALVRRTDQALLDIVTRAKTCVTIVSFAVYRVRELRDALVKALERGVRVVFIFESSEESGGRMTGDAGAAVAEELRAGALMYTWPLEKRERIVGTSGQETLGLLHAKCALGDEDALLVSSANVTGNALSINMELGVLIRGGDLPKRVAGHFQALMTAGILARWDG